MFYQEVCKESKDLTMQLTLPRYATKLHRIDDDGPSHRFET